MKKLSTYGSGEDADIFVLILTLWLAYPWVKGHFEWQKTEPQINNIHSPVPNNLYKKNDQKYS